MITLTSNQPTFLTLFGEVGTYTTDSGLTVTFNGFSRIVSIGSTRIIHTPLKGFRALIEDKVSTNHNRYTFEHAMLEEFVTSTTHEIVKFAPSDKKHSFNYLLDSCKENINHKDQYHNSMFNKGAM